VTGAPYKVARICVVRKFNSNKFYIHVEISIKTWRLSEIFIYSSVWLRYQMKHVKIFMLIDLNQTTLFVTVFSLFTTANRIMTENLMIWER
jgi:hypothetical protein